MRPRVHNRSRASLSVAPYPDIRTDAAIFQPIGRRLPACTVLRIQEPRIFCRCRRLRRHISEQHVFFRATRLDWNLRRSLSHLLQPVRSQSAAIEVLQRRLVAFSIFAEPQSAVPRPLPTHQRRLHSEASGRTDRLSSPMSNDPSGLGLA